MPEGYLVSPDDAKRLQKLLKAFEAGSLNLRTDLDRSQKKPPIETFYAKQGSSTGVKLWASTTQAVESGDVTLWKINTTGGDMLEEVSNITDTAYNVTKQRIAKDQPSGMYRNPIDGRYYFDPDFQPQKFEVKQAGGSEYSLCQNSTLSAVCIQLKGTPSGWSRTGTEQDIYAGKWFSGCAFDWGASPSSTNTGDYIDAYYDYHSKRWEALGAGHHFFVGNASTKIPQSTYGEVVLSLGIGTAHSTTGAGVDGRDIRVQGLADFQDIPTDALVFGWWDGPGGGHWDIGLLGITEGCGITKTTSGAYAIDQSALTGCGLKLSTSTTDCAIDVDPDDLAGQGLVPSASTETPCAIDVGAGCGIVVTANAVHVSGAQLAGDGLVPSTGCAIDVNPGCGIEVVADAVRVKNTDIAGCGLIASSGCSISFNSSYVVGAGLGAVGDCGIDVLRGCGLYINNNNELAVNSDDLASAGAGIIAYTDIGGSSTSCALAVDTGCGLNLSSSGAVQVVAEEIAGCNMIKGSSNGCDIEVDCSALAGDGLLGTTDACCQIRVWAGCGLNFNSSGALQVVAEELAGAGLIKGSSIDCDLAIDCAWLQANSSCFNAALAIQEGCGINVVGSSTGKTISVKNTDLAGNGLVPSATGCGLDVDCDYCDYCPTAGDGLTLNSSTTGQCEIAVAVPGCGITLSASGSLQVAREELMGCGLTAGAGDCDLDVDPTDLAGPGLTTQASTSTACTELMIEPCSTSSNKETFSAITSLTLTAATSDPCCFTIETVTKEWELCFNSGGAVVAFTTLSESNGYHAFCPCTTGSTSTATSTSTGSTGSTSTGSTGTTSTDSTVASATGDSATGSTFTEDTSTGTTSSSTNEFDQCGCEDVPETLYVRKTSDNSLVDTMTWTGSNWSGPGYFFYCQGGVTWRLDNRSDGYALDNGCDPYGVFTIGGDPNGEVKVVSS